MANRPNLSPSPIAVGTVERWVTLDYGPGDQSIEITEKSSDDLGMEGLELNADAARRLAAALAEAADEVEKLAIP